MSDSDVIDTCYRWMFPLGGCSDVSEAADVGLLSPEVMRELYEQVEYPVEWIEKHLAAVGDRKAWLGTIMDVCSQEFASGSNWRGSGLKKDKERQFVATNLHMQTWSVSELRAGEIVR